MKTNDAAMWNEIYTKESFTPGWVSPGTDRNLVRLVGTLMDEVPAVPLGLLDIGCGNGRNSLVAEALAASRPDRPIAYTGVDFAAQAIDYCQRTHGGGKQFRVMDMTAPEPVLRQRFDIVFDCGCFHAIPPVQRGAYLANLARLTHAGSRVVIAAWYRRPERPFSDEPSYYPYLYLHEWFFNAQDMTGIVAPGFELRDEFVDESIYPEINQGFAYFTLRPAAGGS